MAHDYSIDALVSTFSDHAEMSRLHQEQVNDTFLAQNPGQEMPPHMVDPFNIAQAFLVMCSEIRKLKEQLAEK